MQDKSSIANFHASSDIAGAKGAPQGIAQAADDSGHPKRPPRSKFILGLATFLVRRRKPLFYGLLALILAGAVFVPRIYTDNSIELWFLEDDPALVSYNEFKATYGNDEVVVAVIDAGEKGIFEPAFLNRLRAASIALQEESPRVPADGGTREVKLVRRVLSIGKSPWIGLTGATDEATLVVEDLIRGTVETQADADLAKEKFFQNKLWPKLLADKELRRAVVIVEPIATHSMDQRRPQLLAHVRAKLAGFDFRLAGMGVMYNELNDLSFRDGGIFTLLSYTVLVLVVFALFRSRAMTGIIVIVMALSGLAFLDVFGYFRQNINMVTMVLPTLIMILSIADVNHIFNHYCGHRDAIVKDPEAGLIGVYADVLAPSLFTSVTECIGFASICTSTIAVLRTFGVFAAFSAMTEYVIVMVATAFFLGMMKPDRVEDLAQPFEKENRRIIAFSTGHAGLLVAIFAAVILLSCVGISRLEVDTYSMDFLMKGNPVRVDSEAVEATYGNYLPLEVRLRTAQPGGVKEVDFLRRLAAAQVELDAHPDIDKSASLLDVVSRLNQLWTDGRPESYRVPDTTLQVTQLLDFYAGDPDNDLQYMTDRDYRELRLTLRIPMVSAANMKRIEGLSGAILKKHFDGSGTEVVFSGYVPLYVRLLDYITSSQVWSFGSALVYIFLMIGLLFMRFSALAWGISPNVVPIVMTLGVMGFVGVRLDVATVTIASITLGIAVDDTIHELFRYYEFLDLGLTPRASITRCLEMEGTAVICASIILALGFAILGLASIKSVIYFGLLVALTMVFAFLGELFMLPAMITWFTSFGAPAAPAKPPSESTPE